jgi:hypothetical protein
MAEEQQAPLSDDELAGLNQKLKTLSKDLSPKERWFLRESLKSGIMANNEVQGYSLEGGNAYYPSSYQGEYGNGETISHAESAEFPTISIKISVSFILP